MASSTLTLSSGTRMEDVLAHLPVSGTTAFAKGQTIYGPDRPSNSIYLVVSGKVSISQTTGDGSEVLLEIVRPDEIFGESAFLDVFRRSERATALVDTELMAWNIADIEDLVTKRPRLAVALLQILAQRNAESARRIESFAVDNIEQRLARSLLRFAERLGVLEEDGGERMMPFTHALLSQYVGTSREIVTHYMNRFRQRGYVNYSRRGILLYRNALEALLDNTCQSASARG